MITYSLFSGVHRTLGVGVSRIQSISLDRIPPSLLILSTSLVRNILKLTTTILDFIINNNFACFHIGKQCNQRHSRGESKVWSQTSCKCNNVCHILFNIFKKVFAYEYLINCFLIS